MKGTWQGSGTWQTSGPDLGDLLKPALLLLAAAAVVAFIAQILVWLAVILGTLLTAGTVAVVIVWRATRIREARYEASEQHQRLIGATRVTPQVTAPAVQVVEHRHYIYPVTAPDPASAIVRAAITGKPGDAIAEGGTAWHSPR